MGSPSDIVPGEESIGGDEAGEESDGTVATEERCVGNEREQRCITRLAVDQVISEPVTSGSDAVTNDPDGTN
jgi:hypothetical protein